jgi:hypothetical protein
MGDLRLELEKMASQFVSTVLAAARNVPLRELAQEVGGGRPLYSSSAGATREPVPHYGPTPLPRGVRGAPTALKRAVEWQRQLDSGLVRSRAAIARREGLTRARVTQIMNMLRKKGR